MTIKVENSTDGGRGMAWWKLGQHGAEEPSSEEIVARQTIWISPLQRLYLDRVIHVLALGVGGVSALWHVGAFTLIRSVGYHAQVALLMLDASLDSARLPNYTTHHDGIWYGLSWAFVVLLVGWGTPIRGRLRPIRRFCHLGALVVGLLLMENAILAFARLKPIRGLQTGLWPSLATLFVLLVLARALVSVFERQPKHAVPRLFRGVFILLGLGVCEWSLYVAATSSWFVGQSASMVDKAWLRALSLVTQLASYVPQARTFSVIDKLHALMHGIPDLKLDAQLPDLVVLNVLFFMAVYVVVLFFFFLSGLVRLEEMAQDSSWVRRVSNFVKGMFVGVTLKEKTSALRNNVGKRDYEPFLIVRGAYRFPRAWSFMRPAHKWGRYDASSALFVAGLFDQLGLVLRYRKRLDQTGGDDRSYFKDYISAPELQKDVVEDGGDLPLRFRQWCSELEFGGSDGIPNYIAMVCYKNPTNEPLWLLPTRAVGRHLSELLGRMPTESEAAFRRFDGIQYEEPGPVSGGGAIPKGDWRFVGESGARPAVKYDNVNGAVDLRMSWDINRTYIEVPGGQGGYEPAAKEVLGDIYRAISEASEDQRSVRKIIMRSGDVLLIDNERCLVARREPTASELVSPDFRLLPMTALLWLFGLVAAVVGIFPIIGPGLKSLSRSLNDAFESFIDPRWLRWTRVYYGLKPPR